MARVLVGDGHGHSNPVRGMGAARIAERFKAEGGWFMALLSLSPWSYGIEPPSLEAYLKVAGLVAGECREAASRGLKVKCFSGIHPADFDKLIDRYRLKPVEALRLGLRVVGELKRLCREGVIDGIGEVGRPHYKARPERVSIAQAVTEEALLAAEEGCLVQLHLEQAGAVTVETIELIARRLGLSRDARSRVFFHHASLEVARAAVEAGYRATVPGVARLLDYAAQNVEPFFVVESDYIDDPKRPGVVVYPWEMARKLRELAEKGLEEWVNQVAVDNIVEAFGVEPP